MNYKKSSIYIDKFIKVYPFLKGLTDDLIFFIAIDTLFFTVAKGLSAQEIMLLTTISSFVSIISRLLFVEVIKRIGNTYSVRLGIFLLFLSSCFLTFGTSFSWLAIGKTLYELAFVFKEMENVMLRNNLSVLGKEECYASIANKGMIVYAFLTFFVSLVSGIIFNISPYLPMFLGILTCIIGMIIYSFMRDVSNYDVIDDANCTKKKEKIKFDKIIWLIFFSYAIFFGVVIAGQHNSKLLIQYELSDLYNTANVSLYLGVIVAFSRLARLLFTIVFGKVYDRLKNKTILLLTTMLFLSFVLIVIGYFCPVMDLKFFLMALGFCFILGVRDPFRLYTQDIVLKLTPVEEHQVAISYINFFRSTGITMCTLIISLVLLKCDMICVIIGILVLVFIEVMLAVKIYRLLYQYQNKFSNS